jgi:hypothetical protein
LQLFSHGRYLSHYRIIVRERLLTSGASYFRGPSSAPLFSIDNVTLDLKSIQDSWTQLLQASTPPQISLAKSVNNRIFAHVASSVKPAPVRKLALANPHCGLTPTRCSASSCDVFCAVAMISVASRTRDFSSARSSNWASLVVKMPRITFLDLGT